MEAEKFKTNKPELPVDYNGNAIQVWTVGGRTIHVNSEEFVAESSLIRVCSGVSTVKLKLKDRYPIEKDSGMPIPPNSVFCFGCNPGDILMVEGEADITFVREKGFVKKLTPEITLSTLSWDSTKTGGLGCRCEIKDNVAEFSGTIDYYYSDKDKHWSLGANRVGIQVKSEVKISDYPNLVISISTPDMVTLRGMEAFDLDETGKGTFTFCPSVRVPYEAVVLIDWTGTGTVVECFKIKVLAGKTILRNG